MKKKLIFIVILLSVLRGGVTAQNIYESIGKQAELLTLSNGQFQEFFPNDTLVRIGTVLLNTQTHEIVDFITLEDTAAISAVEADVASRFLSVDPIGREYPELTPYQFASNTPIQAIDLDGLEGQFFLAPNTTKNAESQGKVLQKGTTAGDIIDGVIEGVRQLSHDLAPIRPGDENDPKTLGESWDRIKQIPSNLWNMPSNLKKVYSEGTTKEKAKATVEILGLIATFRKGSPKNSISGLVENSFKLNKLGLLLKETLIEGKYGSMTIFKTELGMELGKAMFDKSEKSLMFSIDIPFLLRENGLSTEIITRAIAKYNPEKLLGIWSDFKGMDTNYKIFKNARAAGMTEVEAAFETATGKAAKSNGFTGTPKVTDNGVAVRVEFIRPKSN